MIQRYSRIGCFDSFYGFCCSNECNETSNRLARIGSVLHIPALFFDSATAKAAAEIGEAVGTGDYPGLDRSWDHAHGFEPQHL
jgi:hypothetical protein